MIEFNHFNFNVLNLEKSIAFYKEAIGLSVVREKDSSDGSFKIVYLGDGRTGFTLELTWMRDRKSRTVLPGKLVPDHSRNGPDLDEGETAGAVPGGLF